MPTANERVILLDESNRECGTAEKLEAHRLGLRHRAFSIFLIDEDGRILLQRRALSKYHSPGLWANSCCGHPRPEEPTEVAAARRLREELGVSPPLSPAGAFLYRASVGDELIEHEYDHLFVGRFSGEPQPAASEVMDWRWTSAADLRSAMASTPDEFVVWLTPALAALGDARP
jgi:isopentenyl-diphosphate delta-isomerase